MEREIVSQSSGGSVLGKVSHNRVWGWQVVVDGGRVLFVCCFLAEKELMEWRNLESWQAGDWAVHSTYMKNRSADLGMTLYPSYQVDWNWNLWGLTTDGLKSKCQNFEESKDTMKLGLITENGRKKIWQLPQGVCSSLYFSWVEYSSLSTSGESRWGETDKHTAAWKQLLWTFFSIPRNH